MYQRKYWAAVSTREGGGEPGGGVTNLTGANLVESDKRKRLREHGGGEILLREDEGDEDAREEELGEEGDGFDSELGVCGGGEEGEG